MMQAANLHVVCSMRNCEFFEVPVPTGMLDRFVDRHIEVDPDGYVHVPDGPGIGILLNEDDLDAATTDVKSLHL
jgi:L-alanine-DL-glutamate epimerase-like enolase superfamily enzyme